MEYAQCFFLYLSDKLFHLSIISIFFLLNINPVYD